MSNPERRAGRISAAQAAALWQEYQESRDERIRDRLVLSYAPLVKYIVYKKLRSLPPHCDVDDFVSAGLVALIGAIDRWDPSKGASLEQFAWTRIHGAVLDEMRRLDWAPRSVRRWERDISEAERQFTATQHRHPTNEELADSLTITPDELRRHRDDIATSDLTSLESLEVAREDFPSRRAGSDEGEDLLDAIGRRQASARLRHAITALPKRECEIAILLYVDGLTLREVGTILGVTESRVCQIAGALKRRLRDALQADRLLFEVAA